MSISSRPPDEFSQVKAPGEEELKVEHSVSLSSESSAAVQDVANEHLKLPVLTTKEKILHTIKKWLGLTTDARLEMQRVVKQITLLAAKMDFQELAQSITTSAKEMESEYREVDIHRNTKITSLMTRVAKKMAKGPLKQPNLQQRSFKVLSESGALSQQILVQAALLKKELEAVPAKRGQHQLLSELAVWMNRAQRQFDSAAYDPLVRQKAMAAEIYRHVMGAAQGGMTEDISRTADNLIAARTKYFELKGELSRLDKADQKQFKETILNPLQKALDETLLAKSTLLFPNPFRLLPYHYHQMERLQKVETREQLAELLSGNQKMPEFKWYNPFHWFSSEKWWSKAGTRSEGVFEMAALLDWMTIDALSRFDSPAALNRLASIHAVQSKLSLIPGLSENVALARDPALLKTFHEQFSQVAEAAYWGRNAVDSADDFRKYARVFDNAETLRDIREEGLEDKLLFEQTTLQESLQSVRWSPEPLAAARLLKTKVALERLADKLKPKDKGTPSALERLAWSRVQGALDRISQAEKITGKDPLDSIKLNAEEQTFLEKAKAGRVDQTKPEICQSLLQKLRGRELLGLSDGHGILQELCDKLNALQDTDFYKAVFADDTVDLTEHLSPRRAAELGKKEIPIHSKIDWILQRTEEIENDKSEAEKMTQQEEALLLGDVDPRKIEDYQKVINKCANLLDYTSIAKFLNKLSELENGRELQFQLQTNPETSRAIDLTTDKMKFEMLSIPKPSLKQMTVREKVVHHVERFNGLVSKGEKQPAPYREIIMELRRLGNNDRKSFFVHEAVEDLVAAYTKKFPQAEFPQAMDKEFDELFGDTIAQIQQKEQLQEKSLKTFEDSHAEADTLRKQAGIALVFVKEGQLENLPKVKVALNDLKKALPNLKKAIDITSPASLEQQNKVASLEKDFNDIQQDYHRHLEKLFGLDEDSKKWLRQLENLSDKNRGFLTQNAVSIMVAISLLDEKISHYNEGEERNKQLLQLKLLVNKFKVISEEPIKAEGLFNEKAIREVFPLSKSEETLLLDLDLKASLGIQVGSFSTKPTTKGREQYRQLIYKALDQPAQLEPFLCNMHEAAPDLLQSLLKDDPFLRSQLAKDDSPAVYKAIVTSFEAEKSLLHAVNLHQIDEGLSSGPVEDAITQLTKLEELALASPDDQNLLNLYNQSARKFVAADQQFGFTKLTENQELILEKVRTNVAEEVRCTTQELEDLEKILKAQVRSPKPLFEREAILVDLIRIYQMFPDLVKSENLGQEAPPELKDFVAHAAKKTATTWETLEDNLNRAKENENRLFSVVTNIYRNYPKSVPQLQAWINQQDLQARINQQDPGVKAKIENNDQIKIVKQLYDIGEKVRAGIEVKHETLLDVNEQLNIFEEAARKDNSLLKAHAALKNEFVKMIRSYGLWEFSPATLRLIERAKQDPSDLGKSMLRGYAGRLQDRAVNDPSLTAKERINLRLTAQDLATRANHTFANPASSQAFQIDKNLKEVVRLFTSKDSFNNQQGLKLLLQTKQLIYVSALPQDEQNVLLHAVDTAKKFGPEISLEQHIDTFKEHFLETIEPYKGSEFLRLEQAALNEELSIPDRFEAALQIERFKDRHKPSKEYFEFLKAENLEEAFQKNNQIVEVLREIVREPLKDSVEELQRMKDRLESKGNKWMAAIITKIERVEKFLRAAQLEQEHSQTQMGELPANVFGDLHKEGERKLEAALDDVLDTWGQGIITPKHGVTHSSESDVEEEIEVTFTRLPDLEEVDKEAAQAQATKAQAHADEPEPNALGLGLGEHQISPEYLRRRIFQLQDQNNLLIGENSPAREANLKEISRLEGIQRQQQAAASKKKQPPPKPAQAQPASTVKPEPKPTIQPQAQPQVQPPKVEITMARAAFTTEQRDKAIKDILELWTSKGDPDVDATIISLQQEFNIPNGLIEELLKRGKL